MTIQVTRIADPSGLTMNVKAANNAPGNGLCSGFRWIVIGIQREIMLIHRRLENIRLTALELYNIIIGVNNTPLS
ncbi:hypothetical protein [Brucella intermedia]|uniref:hypothetical protein n=1 Tax=Brucella intermedia TaxID=94625 RepID=UPI001590055A|nr:hypothetical protein [Brucella intermedia]